MAADPSLVPMPLFDRLVDEQPAVRRESPPLRTLDRRGLRESVRRELEHLFNSRISSPAHRSESGEMTVIDYGIPDFAPLGPQNPDDALELAGRLRRVIEAFEPRLEEVEVTIDVARGGDRGLAATVQGILEVDAVREPVSFPALLRSSESEVGIDGDS